MKILTWIHTDRKRSNTIPYTDPSFVVGYDIDMSDFTDLVDKYNQNSLVKPEEDRLYKYVMTVMNIVLLHPKLNPSNSEMDELTDVMFLSGWNALHYIKQGVKPFNYIYRAMYTHACSDYYAKKVAERRKAEAIAKHVEEVWNDWWDAVTDHKTPIADNQ